MDELVAKAPIQPSTNTVHPETEPTKETGEGPVNPQPAPQVQPSPKGKRNREHCRPDQTPWWKYGLEIAAILVGGLVAVIYGRQLNVMERQLEMTDRPWIKDVVRSNSDFLANNGAFSWAVTIRTENVGHSVATAIFPQTKLIAIQGADFIDAPRRKARELCDEVSARFEKVKNDPVVWSNAIFPGEWSEFGDNPILWPTDIKGATFEAGTTKNVFPVLIGCIEYHYATSEKPHRTWFVYTLSHNDNPALEPSSRVFFSIEKTIPNANMVLIKSDQFAD